MMLVPNRIPKNVPTTPLPAHIHRSKNRISPAYMFPNSRREWESVLEKYSTKLNRRFAGQSRGFEPKGAQNCSCTQPPTPLTLIPKYTDISRTEIDSAKVVLTSAVGTGRHSCTPPNASAPVM